MTLHAQKPTVSDHLRAAHNEFRDRPYLLGVHDGHRMGALRFRMGGRFLDDNDELASPPWTSLRELEHASLQLERQGVEKDPDYGRWLQMLIAPGGSLGGARPKASVRDQRDRLWIAKFPSRNDEVDIGAWEHVVQNLAEAAGIVVPEAQLRRLDRARAAVMTTTRSLVVVSTVTMPDGGTSHRR